MKGKKGESATKGVAFSDAPIPSTSKGNIMAAAKRRKRGGAVAPLKVDGTAPKARLDKPKRARGGDVRERSSGLEAAGQKTLGSINKHLGTAGSSGLESAGRKTLASMQKTFDDDAKSAKPKRQRGGKVGADTSPMTHAAHKKSMRGHATEANIT